MHHLVPLTSFLSQFSAKFNKHNSNSLAALTLFLSIAMFKSCSKLFLVKSIVSPVVRFPRILCIRSSRAFSAIPPQTTATQPKDRRNSTLNHKEDKYDGVIVDVDSLPDSLSDFDQKLADSLVKWKRENKRGVWLKVPISRVNLVECAVKQGFVYHHAEKEYLMMTQWLAEKAENKIPKNATHQLGVGCIVINKNNELLAVQERSGVLRGMGVWKMPTGLAEEGEDISDAAIREVFEETGVKTKFHSILCFRQAHNIIFGKSDLFIVCLLDLEDENDTKIRIQESELHDCQWLKPEQYFGQEFFRKSHVHTHINRLVQQVLADRSRSKVNGTHMAVNGATAGAAAPTGGEKTNTDTTDTTTDDDTSPTQISATGGGVSSSAVQRVMTPNIVMSRLPNGLRPGLQTLYYVKSEWTVESYDVNDSAMMVMEGSKSTAAASTVAAAVPEKM